MRAARPSSGPSRRLLATRRTPWQQADWCVVDVETTGLDQRVDQVISVAVVPVRAGRIVAGEMVTTLVHSDRPPSAQSVRVHGLRSVDLVDAPAADDVAQMLASLVRGQTQLGGLVAHYAPVERAFLLPMMARAGIRLGRRMADTEALGRLWLCERDGALPADLSLGRLAAELGLPAHQPHDALGDALTTAQVFIALAALLSAARPQSVGDLLGGESRAANIAAVTAP